MTPGSWTVHNNVEDGSSQQTCGKTDAVVACSCKEFPDERFEERLENVEDSIGQVFASIEDPVEYALELVDDYKSNVNGKHPTE